MGCDRHSPALRWRWPPAPASRPCPTGKSTPMGLRKRPSRPICLATRAWNRSNGSAPAPKSPAPAAPNCWRGWSCCAARPSSPVWCSRRATASRPCPPLPPPPPHPIPTISPPRPPAPDQPYADYLPGRLPPAHAALLPPAQRKLAATGDARALADIADPLSRLGGAGVLLRPGRASPALITLASDTASAQGWRRPLLAWLLLQLQRAEAAGDAEAAAALHRP